MSNPLLDVWNTPHGVPPFDQIKDSHYSEAFDSAFSSHLAEIEDIRSSVDSATFDNSVVALERSGSLLDRVGGVFWNLTSSDTNEELQKIEMEISPRYAAHMSDIYADPALFARIDHVFREEDRTGLSGEQVQLLQDTHQRFVRSGAALSDAARDEVKVLDEDLARLTTEFGQNVLKDTNQFELVLGSEEDLAGLPESVRTAARSEAASRGMDDKFVFTISRSSVTPFLQFSDRRDLREAIYQAYVQCGSNGNDSDNNDIAARIAELRLKRSNLMGFASHAHFMLDDRMAKTPERVNSLLDQIWDRSGKKVREEADDLQAKIQEEGGNFSLAPWDWWYYTEKVRADKFDLDEEEVKPYFPLESVRDGAFDVATRLYGITFTPVDDVPLYHPDVTSYEVREANGKLIGIFLTDYFMRPSKIGGAWMNLFVEQSNLDGPVVPVVVNCCNFPGADPCLLGMDEVRTLFHEFGHALHGLLSQVTYQSLAGTNVKQDFVELPSQIMEHWAIEPAVMKSYARHRDTGEPIPDDLIDKILASQTFNQGFATTEYLAAAYLDMAWHTIEDAEPRNVAQVEETAMKHIDLIDAVDPRYRSTYFQHIFSGSHYSAGYYSYIWAEVLDADGYELFKERGIFDPETAQSFRKNVLERGGTDEPMKLYEQFRGRQPKVEPLLMNRGLA